MTESIYNNAGMPSEQGGIQMSDVPDWAKQFMPLDAAEKAAEMRQENELKQLAEKFSKLADMSEQGASPEIPEDLRGPYNKALSKLKEHGPLVAAFGVGFVAELIERIAALTLERDTLKAERDEFERKGQELCSAYGLSLITIHDLEAKVERLSAPVSDEEIREHYPNSVGVREIGLTRSQINKLIAARASTAPTHPINDDEQRRKDAAWNDRAKARCVCGEMIAWYSGEYLHVDSRSKSCADGRLASPAHFFVGMPPAEPEWQKEQP